MDYIIIIKKDGIPYILTYRPQELAVNGQKFNTYFSPVGVSGRRESNQLFYVANPYFPSYTLWRDVHIIAKFGFMTNGNFQASTKAYSSSGYNLGSMFFSTSEGGPPVTGVYIAEADLSTLTTGRNGCTITQESPNITLYNPKDPIMFTVYATGDQIDPLNIMTLFSTCNPSSCSPNPPNPPNPSNRRSSLRIIINSVIVISIVMIILALMKWFGCFDKRDEEQVNDFIH